MTATRAAGLAAFLTVAAAVAADPPAASGPAGPDAVVRDHAGAEVKLTGVRLPAGVRRLAWLPDSPLAVEFREANSTTYAAGVLTLVPLSAVESVRYDETPQGKAVVKTVTLKAAGLADPLTGPGQFKGINQLDLSGTADGQAVKYQGGAAKGGFQEVRFAGAAAFARKPAGGPTWAVTIDQPKAGNPTLAVAGLKALYAQPGGAEVLTDALPLRAGKTLPLAGLKRLEPVAVNPTTKVVAADAVGDDGATATVVLPPTAEAGGKPATLVGLVGEVPAGWKLFPLHAVLKLVRKE